MGDEHPYDLKKIYCPRLWVRFGAMKGRGGREVKEKTGGRRTQDHTQERDRTEGIEHQGKGPWDR